MTREIIINGKPHPIAFGMRAQKEAAKIIGADFQNTLSGEIDPEKGFDLMLAVARVALNEGARKSGSTVRFSEDNIVDMMDDDPTFMEQIQEMFSESQNVDTEKLGELGESSPREETYPENPIS